MNHFWWKFSSSLRSTLFFPFSQSHPAASLPQETTFRVMREKFCEIRKTGFCCRFADKFSFMNAEQAAEEWGRLFKKSSFPLDENNLGTETGVGLISGSFAIQSLLECWLSWQWRWRNAFEVFRNIPPSTKSHYQLVAFFIARRSASISTSIDDFVSDGNNAKDQSVHKSKLWVNYFIFIAGTCSNLHCTAERVPIGIE